MLPDTEIPPCGPRDSPPEARRLRQEVRRASRLDAGLRLATAVIRLRRRTLRSIHVVSDRPSESIGLDKSLSWPYRDRGAFAEKSTRAYTSRA